MFLKVNVVYLFVSQPFPRLFVCLYIVVLLNLLFHFSHVTSEVVSIHTFAPQDKGLSGLYTTVLGPLICTLLAYVLPL